MASLYLTGDAAADGVLAGDDNALLAGMLLDQQVPMEKAFAGPAVIAERMGGDFDLRRIAETDEDAFVELCSRRPAIHRFPGSMGRRLHQLCRAVVEDYDGDIGRLFAASADGAEARHRLERLPGFGAQKAQIFLALMGKQRGLDLPGWREAAGDYGDEEFRSIADVTDAATMAKVRETKRAAKAAAKRAKDQAKQDAAPA